MSLAARCPACDTVFRVVQDQLRVSEGWVRCGRCAEVFNAIENFVDLGADVASLPSTRSPGRERVIDDLARVSRPFDEGSDESPHGRDRNAPPERSSIAQAPAPAWPAALSGPAAKMRPAPANRSDVGALQASPGSGQPPPAPSAQHAAAVPVPSSPPGFAVEPRFDDAAFTATAAGAADPPPFLRRAERAANWQRPAVRAWLGAAVAAGAVGLAAQAAFTYRDLLAARWPGTRPWLQGLCGVAGCTIEPPRAIDDLVVDSSGLVRVDGTPMVRLTVVLRNRAAMALALPSVDLTLTDSQGGVIARRVIDVAEFGVRSTALPALSELPLQATLSVSERPVSGYTIEIFYP